MMVWDEIEVSEKNRFAFVLSSKNDSAIKFLSDFELFVVHKP